MSRTCYIRRIFYLTFSVAWPTEAVWSWSPPKEAVTVRVPTALLRGVNLTLHEAWPGPDETRTQLAGLNAIFLLAEKETLPMGRAAVPAGVESLTVTVHLTWEPCLT